MNKAMRCLVFFLISLFVIFLYFAVKSVSSFSSKALNCFCAVHLNCNEYISDIFDPQSYWLMPKHNDISASVKSWWLDLLIITTEPNIILLKAQWLLGYNDTWLQELSFHSTSCSLMITFLREAGSCLSVNMNIHSKS